MLQKNKIHEINLTYLTARGNWYYSSWKGNQSKSGGIATNIGIHFFDMLLWIFGSVKKSIVHIHTHDRAAGYLQLEKANVKWFLSINKDLIADKQNVHRSLEIEGEQIDFSSGFKDLHTKSYENIINNKGFQTKVTKPSIELTYQIRNALISDKIVNQHGLCKVELSKHPFQR